MKVRAGVALAALMAALGSGGVSANATVLRGGGIEMVAPADETAAPRHGEAATIDLTALANEKADSSQLALGALGEALRDDARIEAILRGMMQGDAMVPRLALGAARAQSPGAPGPATADPRDVENAALEVDGDGRVSLRQVLQAIRGPAVATGRQRTAPGRGDIDDPDDDIGVTFDLRREVLDSRFLGGALAQIIEVNSVDGTFSIFGMGHFTLASHDQATSDLTAGGTFEQSSVEPLDRPPPHHKESRKVDALALFVAFLQTPTGALVATFLVTALLAWSTRRFAVRPRR